VTEHPILFNSPMVRAILEGRKTQTRRVVKDIYLSMINKSVEINGHPALSVLGGEIMCPYGQPGDRLWVRETWNKDPDTGTIGYKANRYDDHPDWLPWKPSIHMKRTDSRINLEVTGVRVERIHSMREGDVIAEGIEAPKMIRTREQSFKLWKEWTDLWNSINLKRGFGWASNPWVWVVEFKIKGGESK